MIDQTIGVTKILKELNAADFSTATVEIDLGIASGYLWKVKKGKKTLGEDKMKALHDYHASKIKKNEVPAIKISTKNIPKTVPKKQEPMPSSDKKVSLASILGPRQKERFPNKIK